MTVTLFRRARDFNLWSFLIVTFLVVPIYTFAGNPKQTVSLNLKQSDVATLFKEIRKQADYEFVYNENHVKKLNKFDIKATNKSVEDVLDLVFSNTDFTYNITGNVILLRQEPQPQNSQKKPTTPQKYILKGKVTSVNDEPIAGVTVHLKGSTIGTVTDADGTFKIEIPRNPDGVISFTFVGMKPVELKISSISDPQLLNGTKNYVLKMEDNVQSVSDVVVTGYNTVRAASFTGNSVRVSRDEITKIGPRNIISILQVFDPSFRIRENNLMGANPNSTPEFYIRGQSGIGTTELDQMNSATTRSALTNNPNTPIFIMDGYEVSIERIFDLDPLRIESMTILKDAAATAIYGSRAANGVVVVETRMPADGAVIVSYSFTGSVTAPDLTGYNMMNASEKLQAEEMAGFFEGKTPLEQRNKMAEYLAKKSNIDEGVDTYWLSQPLRTAFNHKHNLMVEGGAESWRFAASLKYDNQNGVMKDSFRRRIGGGLKVDYRIKQLQVTNDVTVDVINGEESPYGVFSDYVYLNPYDKPTDLDGKYTKYLPDWKNTGSAIFNPLYEATLNNYNTEKYKEVTDNLSLRWYIKPDLQLRGQFALSYKDKESDSFIDPGSGRYQTTTPMNERGEKEAMRLTNFAWNTNMMLWYNTNIGKHFINATAGINVRSTYDRVTYAEYRGFPSGSMSSTSYANEIVKLPEASDKNTRLFGALASVNYTYDDIYLFDASFRYDGSSEFGSKNKFAPFWSTGLGVNLHKYDFMSNLNVINKFKIRGSYGKTGKVNFPPYVARHMYKPLYDIWYPTGIGISIRGMGNEELKWEKTTKTDVGFDLGMFGSILELRANYYFERTEDLITEFTLPAHTGFTTYMANMGEVEKKGWEIFVNSTVLSRPNAFVKLYMNMSHNKGRIVKIADALKNYNDRIDKYFSNSAYFPDDPKYSKPFMKYQEGQSLTSIWGMRSLGINPADGKEVYVRPDGTITDQWKAADQIVIGDIEPKVRGAFGVDATYKQFSLNASFIFQFGGQQYNQTLVSAVENANIEYYNADKRVLTERWEQQGQFTKLKDIRDRSLTTLPTSRFVQDENLLRFNSLSLSYDFKRSLIQKLHMSMLRLTFNMEDVFYASSIRIERGVSYPYARTFNFTLNVSF